MKSHAKQPSHSEPACAFLSEELLVAQFRGGELLLASAEVESMRCISALTLFQRVTFAGLALVLKLAFF